MFLSLLAAWASESAINEPIQNTNIPNQNIVNIARTLKNQSTTRCKPTHLSFGGASSKINSDVVKTGYSPNFNQSNIFKANIRNAAKMTRQPTPSANSLGFVRLSDISSFHFPKKAGRPLPCPKNSACALPSGRFFLQSAFGQNLH